MAALSLTGALLVRADATYSTLAYGVVDAGASWIGPVR